MTMTYVARLTRRGQQSPRDSAPRMSGLKASTRTNEQGDPDGSLNRAQERPLTFSDSPVLGCRSRALRLPRHPEGVSMGWRASKPRPR